MSWYSTGAEAAEALQAASSSGKRRKDFWIQQGKEDATIRFLAPATQSFNYRRCFIKWAKGNKFATVADDAPFLSHPANLSIQNTFGWWVLDRRKFEIDDKETGEKKTIGPRVVFFADGTRTRKQLVAFEKQQLKNENEDREQDGKDALELKDFNLTHYDVSVSKDKGAPWLFTAKRSRKLSKEDLAVIDKANLPLDDIQKQHALLADELAPPTSTMLASILNQAQVQEEEASVEEKATSYSYDDNDDDVVSFDDD